MITWEDYFDKDLMLGSGASATNFIRSEFDYGVRQRRALKGYHTFQSKIYFAHWEYTKFVEFWEELYDGTEGFYTRMVINGDDSVNKVVRFVSGYTVEQVGALTLLLSVSLEVVSSGTPLAEYCPIVPTDTLVPQDGLTPC